MLNAFVAWWLARVSELLAGSWAGAVNGLPDGVIVTPEQDGSISATVRRRGKREPVTLDVAARLAARGPALLRFPNMMLLEKHHIVPAAPRRELPQMLRHELARITPFTADALFWRWEARARAGDRTRMDVTLTMVPKTALASALAALERIGIKPRFIETGPEDRPRLLSIADESTGWSATGVLTLICAGLAVIALLLPPVRQEFSLYEINTEIAQLRPVMAQVERLRSGIASAGAGTRMLDVESRRIGDLPRVLAAVTRILPDGTYLNDFVLRDRKLTLAGRSAAAARLIPLLSADPTIRDVTFAAPVTRLDHADVDLFSIRADIAP